jgi:cytosine/adenosine deaminase-related metal-dependent hydrolase
LYRKLTATRIFNGYQYLPEDSVLLVNENGLIIDIVPTTEAGSDIEFFEGTLSPGFINCHCHLELSHLKGKVEKNTGLIEFLGKIMLERNASEIDISSAISSAENEMLQNGIVAVGDICNNINTIPQKTKQQLYYHNFIEVAGFPVEMANTRFEKILEVYHQFKTHFSKTSIVPHAPYSVSTALLQKIVEYEENNLICIHNQETIEETILYQKKSGGFADFYSRFNISMDSFAPKGKSSLQDILPQFKINQSLILVHNVFTEQADVEYAQSFYGDLISNLYFCLCPNANLYISNCLPDIEMLFKNNCNFVIGTDSLASNDQLCIYNEINVLKKHFPFIQMELLLQWATINGARALQVDEMYGSFEKGKTPGVLLLGEGVRRIV